MSKNVDNSKSFREKEYYREQIIKMIQNIENDWILREIIIMIENITK